MDAMRRRGNQGLLTLSLLPASALIAAAAESFFSAASTACASRPSFTLRMPATGQGEGRDK
jgi:hypothetical protein